MIDENAYGLLISYFGIEDEEYALEREQFVERVGLFRSTCASVLEKQPLEAATLAVELGHALYLELVDEELPIDPVALLRVLRAALTEVAFESTAVLTYGGRWIAREGASPGGTRQIGAVTVHELSLPSEPLRRALDADAATRMVEDDELVGWGPGLYLDTDAVEALGRKLKNAPTPLEAGGATFFRIGK